MQPRANPPSKSAQAKVKRRIADITKASKKIFIGKTSRGRKGLKERSNPKFKKLGMPCELAPRYLPDVQCKMRQSGRRIGHKTRS